MTTMVREMIDEKELLSRLPIVRSTLQQWVRERRFPAPTKIGPGRKAWFVDEIVAWQVDLERQRISPSA